VEGEGRREELKFRIFLGMAQNCVFGDPGQLSPVNLHHINPPTEVFLSEAIPFLRKKYIQGWYTGPYIHTL
jgi:hypothetical protein